MHPLRHPRNAIAVGLIFSAIGVVYWLVQAAANFHADMAGVTMLIVILFRCVAGHFKPDHHFGFEAVSWYWHFVDVVWLLLFVFVYWL